MFKMIRFLFFLAVLAGGAALYFLLRPEGITIEVPEAEVQKSVEAKFPVSKRQLLVFDLTLKDPEVNLRAGADRLQIRTRAELKVAGSSDLLKGYGTISSGVDFDSETGTFYLTDVQFDKIEIDGVPERLSSPLDEAANLAARDSLNRVAFYTMEEGETKTALTKLVLKKVQVRDGKLLLRLGLR